ncbi:hypothetical protein [Acidianus manzaensis]|uniref:Uncharacterized protein n=1 Tax=Acidianus manzaensis TaxID=282676 RepID=A0A1W6K0T6_9CREN|nr:hypothetical protein [Acidianus manzaensis]ARM76148.1 hypothetical protein B6F84_09040 [Acidianus manzaensis]
MIISVQSEGRCGKTTKETSISNYKKESSIQCFGIKLIDNALYGDLENTLFEHHNLSMSNLQQFIFTNIYGIKVSNNVDRVNFKIVCQKRGH